ncbi:Hint domain-containing protein [Halocynthiibacter namhaensis]|uniref:Hint domain-containing protein n=1 Tax=Halocynthiibacter namhaensis TaxID=1290553 RepID=UPI001EE34518|nr:Hint domain-containing protein [Halocynthiibacter namhaensis]
MRQRKARHVWYIRDPFQHDMLPHGNEALVPAKHMVNDVNILRKPGGMVEYFHMMFDTHQIVFAEGALSESFHPGAASMESVSEASRREIYELFPELEQDCQSYGHSARPSLKGYEARVLMA